MTNEPTNNDCLQARESSHTQMKVTGKIALTRLGFYARTELGRADVAACRGPEVLCLEIEDAPNLHVMVNIHRDFSAGAKFVAVVCPDFGTQAAVCRLLKRELTPELWGRVAVLTYSFVDFLAQLPRADANRHNGPANAEYVR